MPSRRRLVLLATACIVATAVAAACGEEAPASTATLPPIATTSTTTTTIPTTTTIQRYYTVQRGDTLFKIAQKFGVTMDALADLNGIVDRDDIHAGIELEIPTPTVVATTVDPAPDGESTTSSFVGVTMTSVAAASS